MAEDKRDAQENMRKELEQLLMGNQSASKDISESDEISEGNDSPIVNDDGKNPLNKVQHPDTKNMDFYKVKEEAEGESRKLLKSVIDFYLDAKIIKKNEYVKYKKAVDEMAIANVIFSLKTTQHAIIKLMEEIDMGNIHPRIFEVLAQLQGQMMSIIKHQAALAITMEEGYKKIKDDHDRQEYMKSLESGENSEPGQDVKLLGEPLKVRGTKNIMLEIKNRVNDIPFEDVTPKEEQKPRLTDPHNRPANPLDAGNDVEDKFDDEQGFGIDEDMF